MPLISLAMTATLIDAWADVQTQMQTECAIKTIAYEARGESERGQRAIAEVIQNRMATGFYPDDICGVIAQEHQFEWYWRERTGRLKPLSEDEYTNAARVWFSYEYGGAKREVLLPCHTTFINPRLVKKRRGGHLPEWWTAGTSPRTIGNHEFRCEPRIVASINK